MASLLKSLQKRKSAYRDRKFEGSQEEYERALEESTTVYVGNLSFYTSEEQIHELFKKAGDVKRIVMGLDRNVKTPCGFCFVIYYTRADAEACVRFVNETFLDDRLIRVDIDWGFQEGRQYGRGKSGGQVRDERRTDYDEGRGGFGKLMQQEMSVPGPFEMGMEVGAPQHPQNLPFRGPPVPDSERHRPRKRNRSEGEETLHDSREKRQRDEGPSSNPRFRERREEQEED